MPILVVGADHPLGVEIIHRLVEPDREVRAFVSDPVIAADLRSLGAKVAIGDLSDEGHVAAASAGCFSLACVEAALDDGRELSFLTASEVPAAWARAATEAAVKRVIWVGEQMPVFPVAESVRVPASLDPLAVAEEVARLDDLATL